MSIINADFCLKYFLIRTTLTFYVTKITAVSGGETDVDRIHKKEISTQQHHLVENQAHKKQ